MATPAEIIAALREVDRRVAALRERALANGETALREGDWRVRDALSHVAARANPLPMAEAMLSRAAGGGAASPGAPPMDIHGINAAQVDDRKDRSVAAILDEIHAGHAAAIAAVGGLDAARLAQRVKIPFPPGETGLGDLLLLAGPRHSGSHVAEIEAALAGR